MRASEPVRRTFTFAAMTIVLVSASAAPRSVRAAEADLTAAGPDAGPAPARAAADGALEPAAAAVAQRVEARLAESDLPEAARSQMRQNLQRILELGLPPQQVELLFPGARPGRGPAPEMMLRWQHGLLQAAAEGLPAEALLDKLCEGRRKGADPQRLESAFGRMEQDARFAHRAMQRARQQGVRAQDDPRTERALTRGLALDLWRGLGQDELDRLVDGCSRRAAAGTCSTLELCAAAETAVQLSENGVDASRAAALAEGALARGYTAAQMRRLAHLVAAGRLQGGHVDEIVSHLEQGVREHEDLDAMERRMMQWQWMGPADDHGHGGQSPVDDVLGGGHGGPQHRGGDGGMDGSGGHGGPGADSGGGSAGGSGGRTGG